MQQFGTWLRNIRMNYTAEQNYIAHRMLHDQWQAHLQKTKQYIISRVERTQPNSIRILGSGWLFDTPIDYLIQKCSSISLSDIQHPRQVVNRYGKTSNVKFETEDLTYGLVDKAYTMKKRDFGYDDFITSAKLIDPRIYSEDLVVSVNLLSQLSAFIIDYLSKKTNVKSWQLDEIATVIQQNHLRGLPQGRSVLVSDYEEEYLDEHGNLIGSKPSVYIDIPRNVSTMEWGWQFDTQMTYREDCKTNLKVMATEI